MTAMRRVFRNRAGLPWWFWRRVANRRDRLDAEFSPLIAEPFIWYDPSDLATLFQVSDGTVAVAADNDPAGYTADKSGSGYHWVQSTAGSRPLYKTSGELHRLDFDGVDDGLASDGVELASGLTAIYGLQTTDTSFVSFWGQSNQEFFGVGTTGNSASPDSTAGVPSYRVNNGAALARTRDAYYDAVGTGLPVVVEVRNLDLSTWTEFHFGNYSTFQYVGSFFGLILAPEASVSPVRDQLLAWMAAKTGATLA